MEYYEYISLRVESQFYGTERASLSSNDLNSDMTHGEIVSLATRRTR